MAIVIFGREYLILQLLLLQSRFDVCIIAYCQLNVMIFLEIPCMMFL